MLANTTIDYYFAPMSGYAYLGHARFLALAAEAGSHVNFHPLNMARIFAAAGSFPPAKYPSIRQHHRKADMARWAQKRSLPINKTPAFWPAPMELSCQVIVAAKHLGMDQGAVSNAVLSAVWFHDLNIADAEDLSVALREHGINPTDILEIAQQPAILAEAEAETAAAINIGIFGSPTYVYCNEWFFGQDRLDFLADQLRSTV